MPPHICQILRLYLDDNLDHYLPRQMHFYRKITLISFPFRLPIMTTMFHLTSLPLPLLLFFHSNLLIIFHRMLNLIPIDIFLSPAIIAYTTQYLDHFARPVPCPIIGDVQFMVNLTHVQMLYLSLPTALLFSIANVIIIATILKIFTLVLLAANTTILKTTHAARRTQISSHLDLRTRHVAHTN